MKWICSQIGAREHYAIPRALRHGNAPSEIELFTDWWIPPALSGVTGLGVGRYHPELSSTRVQSCPYSSTYWEIRRRFFTGENPYQYFLKRGIQFGEWIRDRISRSERYLNDQERVLFCGYDTGFFEPAQYLNERGVPGIVFQIDPAETEYRIVERENEKWAGWAIHDFSPPVDYQDRRRSEWSIASRVVVNSEWSRRALIEQGVQPERISVVPLAWETSHSRPVYPKRFEKVFTKSTPLKVLFLGQVILRKGIPYLIEAAGRLRHRPVRFDIVGPIGIRHDMVEKFPDNVRVNGSCPPMETCVHYQSADVFILPTLSDGFAITQIEAMGHGLPVIATERCGEVVDDAIDGFRILAGDADSIVRAVERYLENPDLIYSQSAAAMRKSTRFSLARLQTNLQTIAEEVQVENKTKHSP